MKVVSFDVDSSERDPTVYRSPNDYTVRLNKRLYGVTKITLTAARIPNSQYLICAGNRQICVDNQTYLIKQGNYTNGFDLASNVQLALTGSKVDSVTFNELTSNLVFSNTDSQTFNLQFFSGSNGYATTSTVGPPASVLGFSGEDVSGSTVSSGPIDLTGPSAIFMRITIGSDDLDRDVFVNGGTFAGGVTSGVGSVPPHYVGRIVLNGPVTTVTLNDTPIEYLVPSLNCDSFRLRFYWNNGTKLVPYDFGNRNHILKFNVTCETDRFNKIYEMSEDPDTLPPPVEDVDVPKRPQSLLLYGLALLLIIGLIVLLRTSAAGAVKPS